jgi:hypothetical protein
VADFLFFSFRLVRLFLGKVLHFVLRLDSIWHIDIFNSANMRLSIKAFSQFFTAGKNIFRTNEIRKTSTKVFTNGVINEIVVK